MKRLAAEPVYAPPAESWRASLALGFTRDGDVSRMTERVHSGPLRVQKPLYPEGPAVCHAIIVHPPGGVVGGDQLVITARTDAGAQALLTTPGAAKWYKGNQRTSRQTVALQVAAGGSIEWLPQETIFFDDAYVQLDNTIELSGDAVYTGCEILCFGRTASGESFNTGKIAQRTAIRRDGKLIWFEQGELTGGSRAMASPLGLNSKTVCATLIATGTPLSAAALSGARQTAAEAGESDAWFGMSQLKSVLVARYLGHSSEAARKVMTGVWQDIRPVLTGRAAVLPRIWNT